MDHFTSSSKKQASEAAYAAVQKLKPESTSVVEYQSKGHVIVISDPQGIELLGELPKELTSEIISYEGLLPNDDVTIAGALGQFEVTVAEQQYKADLVLDLTPISLMPALLKPPGYFHLAETTDESLLQEQVQSLKAELGDLIGTFEKPRYFEYDASACAHGRSGKQGCTRCIDACPADAISSLLKLDKIRVDPNLCQGGGVCATVCPSSAITYAYPKPQDLLTHIRTLILAYRETYATNQQEQEAPNLIFVTENEQARAEQMLPAALVITVEEVASVGPEAWLSALAWGAQSIYLLDLDAMPVSSRAALDLHCEMVQTILHAMNYPETVLSIISDQGELLSGFSMPAITTAQHAPISKKRQAFYMALDHLVEQSEPFELRPEVLLPIGAIFGDVTVDQSRCTLCMSCVNGCPGNALQAGIETPKLSFLEANCLQCGICTNTCPEGAITISPRLLLDREARNAVRLLNEDTAFCCTTCGKPYATTFGITTIMAKLEGHSMFADERSKSRLKMCEECRVKDMMDDPNTDF